MSSSCGHEFKRRLSEITQDSSPQPLSPADLPSKKARVGDTRSPSPDPSADADEAAKRARLEGSPASPESDPDSKGKESYISRRKRFLRTAEVGSARVFVFFLSLFYVPVLYFYVSPCSLAFLFLCSLLVKMLDSSLRSEQ